MPYKGKYTLPYRCAIAKLIIYIMRVSVCSSTSIKKKPSYLLTETILNAFPPHYNKGKRTCGGEGLECPVSLLHVYGGGGAWRGGGGGGVPWEKG